VTAPKRPAHRPLLPLDQRMVVVSVRLSPAERDKLAALGGGAWLRGKLKAARLPPA
jgi:hypothetical protein